MAAQLAEQGSIILDAPVSQYGAMIVNPLGRRSITLRDLLTHRSGLCVDTYEANWRQIDASPTTLVGANAHAPEYGNSRPRWAHPVGECFEYSSLGFAIAAEILGTATGRTFTDCARTEISEPLDMTRTSWQDVTVPTMTGYMVFGDTAVPSPAIASQISTSTGIVTSAIDYTRLLSSLLPEAHSSGRRMMTPEILHQMVQPQSECTFFGKPTGMYTGVGIEICNIGSKQYSVGHVGAYPFGWWSVGWAYPELDLAVTAAGNAWDMRQYEYLPGCWAWLMSERIAKLRAGEPLDGHRLSQEFIAGVVAGERFHALLGIGEKLAKVDLADIARQARQLPKMRNENW
ncbi:serine hydrolase domain-containing protein, partial [Streptomyces sp. NPDC002285]